MKRSLSARPLATLCLLSSFFIAGCGDKPAPNVQVVEPPPAVAFTDAPMLKTTPTLIDRFATAEARSLYLNLADMRGKHVLFGHQDSLAYGVNWEGDEERSDVHDVTGAYPALYGWDIGGLELGHSSNLDGVDFAKMRDWIRLGFVRGGVITISWHMNNPASGGDSWEKTPAVHELIPGGIKHHVLKAYLDKFVEFNQTLMVSDYHGQPLQVPVIFRPWHEHNGDWFWWGKGHASEADFRELWQFTVKYLRDERKQHNLIYAYSPDRSRINDARFDSEYLWGYPGDEFVDIIGLDNYWDLGHDANTASVDEQKASLTASLKAIVNIADTRNKIAALTETGQNGLKSPNFWTDRLLGSMLSDPDSQRITYLHVWRNANKAREKKDEFFAPFKGQATEGNFNGFYQNPYILFEDELPNMYFYEEGKSR